MDAIAPHLDHIVGSVGAAAIGVFGIDVTRIHWDMTVRHEAPERAWNYRRPPTNGRLLPGPPPPARRNVVARAAGKVSAR